MSFTQLFGDTMKPTRLRVPREEASDFADDLTAWASAIGVDPAPTVVGETRAPTETGSAVLYQVYVNNSFFEQFPEWRMYIQQ